MRPKTGMPGHELPKSNSESKVGMTLTSLPSLDSPTDTTLGCCCHFPLLAATGAWLSDPSLLVRLVRDSSSVGRASA